jgi:hypothetical protein
MGGNVKMCVRGTCLKEETGLNWLMIGSNSWGVLKTIINLLF